MSRPAEAGKETRELTAGIGRESGTRHQERRLDSESPTIVLPPSRSVLTARVSRRQVLKASLIGMGGLATAVGGLGRLEILAAMPSSLGRWRRLSPPVAPGPRGRAAMAFDAARGTAVLFGGEWNAGAETWTWDGRAWSHLSPSVSPPSRAGASFSYHPPTRTLVLFGGLGLGTQGVLGDTWRWDGAAWSSGPSAGPPPRIGASMAFDPPSGNLILYGGFDTKRGILNDTWKWDGISWTQLSPRFSPPGNGLGLFGAGLAYSSAAGKLILFGGQSHREGVGGPMPTWAWDGTNWSEFLAAASSPPGRRNAAMAADPGGRLILLFGGFYCCGPTGSLLDDTWTLTSTWSQDTRTPTPPAREGAALVADPSGNSFLLFGGEDDRAGLMNDTWKWELV